MHWLKNELSLLNTVVSLHVTSGHRVALSRLGQFWVDSAALRFGCSFYSQSVKGDEDTKG